MRAALILFTILPLFCKAQADLKDLAGKWQEIKRSGKKDKPIDFADTMRIEIRPDGFMMIRQQNGPTIIGEAEIIAKKLIVEDVKFNIVDFAKDTLLLNDKSGTHYFRRIIEFTLAPVKKVIPGVETGSVDLSFAKIEGKWTIYKKTDAEFNSVKFYLKSIHFKEDKGNKTYEGSTTFNNSDSVYSASALIRVNEFELVVTTDQGEIKLLTKKSDGEEMIFESGTVHYFLKRFGKK